MDQYIVSRSNWHGREASQLYYHVYEQDALLTNNDTMPRSSYKRRDVRRELPIRSERTQVLVSASLHAGAQA